MELRVASFILGIWSALITVLFIRSVKEGDVFGIYIGVTILIITVIVAVSVIKEEAE